MSTDSRQGVVAPIIIVRRSATHHDAGHKGGVWKIAFADFMTAMMAFFLVLWIVNSTSKETRISLARYFNPIQVAEKSAQRKGVEALSQPRHSAQVADQSPDGKEVEAEAASHSQGVLQIVQTPQEHGDTINSARRDAQSELFGRNVRIARPSSQNANAPERARWVAATPAATDDLGQAEKERADLSGSLVALSRAVTGSKSDVAPSIVVTANTDGVKIVLTDNDRFSMFDLGSAKLNVQAMAILKRISSAIAEQPGSLFISGHTDGRPYQRGRRTNWQLSAERAFASAQAMIRFGVNKSRIEKLEAYGDSKHKFSDPLAAENRRIEILLRQN